MNETKKVKVLAHSAIRIEGEKTVYIDPFHVKEEPHDADLILITHEHYDHLSPEDIARVAKETTWYAVPKTCREEALKAGLPEARLLYLAPGEKAKIAEVPVEAVPAYNVGKQFHTKERNWLGYVVSLNGLRYYIAGDTDNNEDTRKVRCDVALLPVGGKYTMTAEEAAELANAIKPLAAVPTHYGDIVGTAEAPKIFAEHLDPAIACDTAR